MRCTFILQRYTPGGGSCTDPTRSQHALLCSKRKADESEEEENEENQTSNSSGRPGRRPKREKAQRTNDNEDDADDPDNEDGEPERPRPPPPTSPHDYADLACSWYEDGGGLSFGGTKRPFMNTAQYKAVYNFLHFFCISIVTLLIAQNIILLPVGILFGAINYSDKLLSINDGNPHGKCDD